MAVAMPVCRHGRDPLLVGVSPLAPGAYAEQVVVQEAVAFAVPNGLSAENAALTEPLSVSGGTRSAAVRLSRGRSLM